MGKASPLTLYFQDIQIAVLQALSRSMLASGRTGTSKSAKKRAKEKEKEQEARSLASRVGRQAEVRVISSGGQASNRSGRGGLGLRLCPLLLTKIHPQSASPAVASDSLLPENLLSFRRS